jgi:NAD(P)-dependent dehydrogenase (short-subunit alcohol dehydrogenase family)
MGIAVRYNSDASRQAAEESAKAIEVIGAEAIVFQGHPDQRRREQMAVLGSEPPPLGSIDVAINTFGQVLRKSASETPEEEFDPMSAVNNKSAYFLIKQACIHLVGEGNLLTIVTSLLGAFAPRYSTYGGAKAPVEHCTRVAEKEFAERGISVNAVGPWPVDIPFFYCQEPDETTAFHKSMTALSAFSSIGLIENIAPFVRFIVTEGWWMTGQTILINGGHTTK